MKDKTKKIYLAIIILSVYFICLSSSLLITYKVKQNNQVYSYDPCVELDGYKQSKSLFNVEDSNSEKFFETILQKECDKLWGE